MVGGVICSIATCKSYYLKAIREGEKLSFFSFPKEPKLQEEWKKKCYRKGEWCVAHKRICSKHFKLNDFEDEIQARIMNTQPRRLKKYAVPSLNLPDWNTIIEKPDSFQRTETEESVKPEQDQEIVETELTQKIIKTEPDEEIVETEKRQEFVETEFVMIKNEVQVPKIKIELPFTSKEDNVDILNRKIEALQQENAALKKKLEDNENKNSDFQHYIFLLNEQLTEQKVKFEDKVHQVFKDVLTKNQIEIVLKKKTRARWTREELLKAYQLLCYSEKAYIYLKNILHYPLPGVATLQQWAVMFNVNKNKEKL